MIHTTQKQRVFHTLIITSQELIQLINLAANGDRGGQFLKGKLREEDLHIPLDAKVTISIPTGGDYSGENFEPEQITLNWEADK